MDMKFYAFFTLLANAMLVDQAFCDWRNENAARRQEQVSDEADSISPARVSSMRAQQAKASVLEAINQAVQNAKSEAQNRFQSLQESIEARRLSPLEKQERDLANKLEKQTKKVESSYDKLEGHFQEASKTAISLVEVSADEQFQLSEFQSRISEIQVRLQKLNEQFQEQYQTAKVAKGGCC